MSDARISLKISTEIDSSMSPFRESLTLHMNGVYVPHHQKGEAHVRRLSKKRRATKVKYANSETETQTLSCGLTRADTWKDGGSGGEGSPFCNSCSELSKLADPDARCEIPAVPAVGERISPPGGLDRIRSCGRFSPPKFRGSVAIWWAVMPCCPACRVCPE